VDCQRQASQRMNKDVTGLVYFADTVNPDDLIGNILTVRTDTICHDFHRKD